MLLQFFKLNLIYLIMTTALFAYGHLIIRILKIKDLSICKFKSSNLLFAIIFIGLIGLILSFFTSINDYIVSALVTFGLIIVPINELTIQSENAFIKTYNTEDKRDSNTVSLYGFTNCKILRYRFI